MNSVQLVGRLTRDPEVKYADNGTTVARFNIACDRRFRREGDATADFISCVAFGPTAEFMEKYFFKGKKIGLNGRIQTGSYTNKDGQKVYTTDVIAENVEFVESKNASEEGGFERNRGAAAVDTGDGFMRIPDDVEDESLPFN